MMMHTKYELDESICANIHNGLVWSEVPKSITAHFVSKV